MTIGRIAVNLLKKADFTRLLFLIDVIRGLRFWISKILCQYPEISIYIKSAVVVQKEHL